MPPLNDFADIERTGWSDPGIARHYAENFAEATAQCVPALLAGAGVRAGAEALNLCCGHGILAEGLHRRGARVTGLDFSAAMLGMAAARVPGACFVQGDAMALPFEDDGFDCITIGFGIPHVPDPPRVFAEAARVLREGGRLAYSVWRDPAEAGGAFAYVFRAIARHGDPAVALPAGPGAHDYADLGMAARALADAGFAAPDFDLVQSAWTAADPAAPYYNFRDGSVRGAALLRAQAADRQAAIRDAVAEEVKRELGEVGPWRIPIPAIVVSAQLA